MSARRLLCHPGLPYRSLARLRGKLPEVFRTSNVHFYRRGSTSIWHGLQVLPLRAGDTVLFPSYHCGIELDVLLKAGLKVRFYRIDSEARIDTEDLQSSMDSTIKALYVIHQFGVPAPVDRLRTICDDHDLIMIEDCALGLYSRHEGRVLGSFGDIAVFSTRKTIAIPAGGVLRINDSGLPAPTPTRSWLFYEILKVPYLVIQRDVLTSRLWNSIVRYPAATRGNPGSASADNEGPNESIRFKPGLRDGGMSVVSRWLLAASPHEAVLRKRRRNFEFLLESMRSCERVRPLIGELPEAACPFVFPVMLNVGAASFIAFCRSRGIIAEHHWPALHPELPVDRYPDAVMLKQKLVALPIHQDLREEDLERLRQTILDFDREFVRQSAGG